MLDILFPLVQSESQLVAEEMGPPESSRWNLKVCADVAFWVDNPQMFSLQ